MIAVDTNILVYSHRSEITFHGRALLRLKSLAEGSSQWSIPWPCIHEFLSVVTNRRAFDRPTPLPLALEQARQWQNSGSCLVIGEGPNHFDVLSDIMIAAMSSGGQVHDARIAAICLQHGVSELWTADRDFSLYPALKTRNPLVA